MLAGSTRSSTLSPARIWPVAKSISAHAVPVMAGASGTGNASLSAAGAAGAGTAGAGSWAKARPSVATDTAANSATRTAWAFIRRGTPGISGHRQADGRRRGQTLILTVRVSHARSASLADRMRRTEAQAGDARAKLGDARGRHRPHAQAPHGLARGRAVMQACAADPGTAQQGERTLGVVAGAEGRDLQEHARSRCGRERRRRIVRPDSSRGDL